MGEGVKVLKFPRFGDFFVFGNVDQLIDMSMKCISSCTANLDVI